LVTFSRYTYRHRPLFCTDRTIIGSPLQSGRNYYTSKSRCVPTKNEMGDEVGDPRPSTIGHTVTLNHFINKSKGTPAPLSPPHYTPV